MCFSAQASFGASALLSIISILSIKKATKRTMYPLVCIPVFFALQQACEGVVWLTYDHPQFLIINKIAMYSFLFFAFFLWPIWISFALLCLEKRKKIKDIFLIIMGIGSTVASGLVWSIYFYGAQTTITCSHIAYDIAIPRYFYAWGIILYCIATIAPFFLSSKKEMWIFGGALFISVALTLYAYAAYFTSVWCFFAALLSTMLYRFIK